MPPPPPFPWPPLAAPAEPESPEGSAPASPVSLLPLAPPLSDALNFDPVHAVLAHKARSAPTTNRPIIPKLRMFSSNGYERCVD